MRLSRWTLCAGERDIVMVRMRKGLGESGSNQVQYTDRELRTRGNAPLPPGAWTEGSFKVDVKDSIILASSSIRGEEVL